MSVSGGRGVFPAACTQFHPDFSSTSRPRSNTWTRCSLPQPRPRHDGQRRREHDAGAGRERELLKATLDHVRKRVPVLVGVVEYTTAQACRWAAESAKLGADGLMVLAGDGLPG
ncbi:MAG: hypothetical protein U0871_29055 [Gemmataceae bacterium]